MPILNQNIWGGVCGFVSVLHALSERDGGLVGETVGQGSGILHQRLGAEMKTYLRMTQIERPGIAQDIEEFSRTFDGFENFTINEAITKIEQAARTDNFFQMQWKYDAKLGLCGGVAMPLNAVLDYLNFVGLRSKMKFTNAKLVFTQCELRKYKDCIVGVGNKSQSNTKYRGLRHWVYVDKNGYLWNWGNKKEMKKSSARPYEDYPDRHNCIIHVIAINK
ncbi:MAG: hypothetical protein PHY54_04965 [Methylococcales bacterium]|nr:hypothetical protein [Methylococcales bacterium]